MNVIFDFFDNFDMPAAAAELSDKGSVIYMNKKAREITHGDYKMSLNDDDIPLLREGSFLRRTCCGEISAEVFTTLVEHGGKKFAFEIKLIKEPNSEPADGSLGGGTPADWANCAFCSAMQAEEPDLSPQVMLKNVCAALSAERIYIYEKTPESGYVCSHFYAESGAAHAEDLSQEMCAVIRNALAKDSCAVIVGSDLAKVYEQPLSDILNERGLHSFAAVPIFDGEDEVGFCCAEDFPVCICGRASKALETFRRAGSFIGSCLKWSRLFTDLKKIGLTDHLTDIGNRHAMENFRDTLKVPMPIGLVYCDISGLKRINDTLGHCAGDEYIQNACSIMKRIFPSETLFRIGGDELLAVLTDTDETEMLGKVSLLKSELASSSVAMAVGSAFGIAGGKGIDALLHTAEVKMYNDKTAYYKKSGRERRRY